MLAVVVAAGVAGRGGAGPAAAEAEAPEVRCRFPMMLPSDVNQNYKGKERKNRPFYKIRNISATV